MHFILYSITGKSDALYGFLKSEYSDENYDFWFAVEEFRRSNQRERINKAFLIMNEFVDKKAKRQVSFLLNILFPDSI